MTIPDDPAALARWLEDAIVSGDVRRLADELRVIHGLTPEAAPSLAAYQAALPNAERAGLTALPAGLLRRTLTHPDELLALAEHLLMSGGAYWDARLAGEPGTTEAVADGWERLKLALPTEIVVPAGKSKFVTWLMISAPFVTAAAILVAVFVMNPFRDKVAPQGDVAWGWQKPDAFAPAPTREEYLTRLADSTNDWFKKRPDDKPALAKRITEFRQGCDALLAADHKPLPAADQAWLKERCQLWRGKLDEQLTKLETDPAADPKQVRDATDAIVNKLADALRGRAKTA